MTEKAGSAGKDVLYIDVDDEITGIIDKVRGSHSKIVALVLPKRATVLQSIVNMKLMKRAAEESKKNIVLITSEAGLLPLAGSVGVHVAKSLQSKPEIPDAPERGDGRPEDIDEEDDSLEDDDVKNQTADDKRIDKSKSIGELAGAAAAEETIELDDDIEEEPDSLVPVGSAGAAAAKKGKDKKLRIPNFNRFRLVLILGGVGVVALIALLIVCVTVLPKAAISIKTDSQSIASSSVVTLKTASDAQLSVDDGIVPAKSQEVQKTITQQAPATGQQNNGEKASGTVRFYNCDKDDTLSGTTHTLPAGTGISANGLAFITTDSVTIPPSHFSGNNCKLDVPSGSVGMIAQLAGAKYNQAATTYKVGGYSTFSGDGSATTGGTDDITKIVTQADIDGATQKIGAQDTTGIKEELKTDLTNAGETPVAETFAAGAPDTKTSVNAGDPADAVTVTQVIKYTMLGVKQDDLKKIVAASVSKKIDPKRQSILDYGLTDATYGLQNQTADGTVIDLQTNVIAGPDLHAEDLKKQVAGKKAGDAKETIKQNPGVTEVDVKYSPFWVSAIPKKTSRITITIEKPAAAKADSSSNASNNP